MNEVLATATAKTVVTPQLTADSMGSGSLAVFATPGMCALMEQAATMALQEKLSDGQTSVGTALNIEHVSATPVGMTAYAKADLLEFNGKVAKFVMEAYDEAGLIGKGTHTRVVVNALRFMEKTEGKMAK